VTLQNQRSSHFDKIIEALKEKGFKTKIIKTEYEFQKGADEILVVKDGK
jgi:methanogenic corrinoid protein MtbC1